ncbi:hydantoinase B/oxoprolinase family protein [Rhabdothermincola sediminis]|uniref:hydantoinase B/oxoprolinase family protein n=1 Tax=Rhabdothermincola sediminis TaxID=2751370 RepID=UPI001AA00DC4|nr:hydantoinase B/oxoprolinase family protein [Rhabdothermincola sediminis]
MHVDLVKLAGSRGRLVETVTVDPVTAEVIRDYMETVCFEMATYVSRTATTPILNQSNERNATILDAQGRLAALSVGIPQFMLTSTLPVRFALEFLGPEEFREGDVFVANDPYHGGGHLPDYNVFAPVFTADPSAPGGRRMVLIASIQCHHGDTGGAVPGGYNVTANDLWGEGVRWPVLKVVDQGRERRDVLYALAANNRLPDYLGDIRAQIGAAQLATARLGELLDRWGAPTVEQSVDYMIDYAAKRFREEVRAWPDGIYEADTYVDHDPLGHPDVHLHVKVTVSGERLTIDFTGSDDRQQLQAWSTFGNTRGYTVGQIAAMMDPEIPKNEGFFDSIELVVPQGCVLNPHPGKPVSAGTHHPGAEVGEVIALAMQHVLPDKAVPQVYKTGIPTVITGIDPRTGQPFTDHSAEVYAGWCNAAKGMDAWGCQAAAFGNLWKATAEINESLYPHIQWGRDYRTDSGGPGQWRGLCGSHYVKEVRVDAKVYTYVVGMKYPMPGIAGGKPGAPNKLTIRWGSDDPFVVEHTAEWVPMSAGQKINYDYGGGGGWGDPLERDPQAVLDDVLDEYVSVEGAARDYGVVLRGSLAELTLEVDETATAELRAARRVEVSGEPGDGIFGGTEWEG